MWGRAWTKERYAERVKVIEMSPVEPRNGCWDIQI